MLSYQIRGDNINTSLIVCTTKYYHVSKCTACIFSRINIFEELMFYKCLGLAMYIVIIIT